MVLHMVWRKYSINLIFRFDTLRPPENGRHFADCIFKFIFLYEDCFMSIQISPNLVPNDPINNKPALVQIMVPKKRHAITKTNDGLVYWRTYASLDLVELIDHSGSYSGNWLNKDSLISVECVTHKRKDSGGADDSGKHWWVTLEMHVS